MANNLTLSSATYDTSTQKFGTAALNGGYGSIIGASVVASYPYTLEAWVKSAAPAGITVAMGQNGTFAIATPGSSSGHLRVYTGGSSFDTSVNIADSAWHHVALVVTSSTATAYVDGALAGSGSHSVAVNTSTSLGIRAMGDGTLGWPGSIDEAVVWPSAKYTTGFTAPSSPYAGSEGMTALWHLDSNGTDSANSTAPTITAPTVSNLTVGGTSTISGSWTNGAPTGFTYSLDSGGAVTATSPVIITTSGSGGTAVGTYSFNIATPAAGGHTITVTETGIASPATSLSTTFTAVAGVVIAPNNSALIYSPGNWLTSSSAGKTICGGAYVRTIFTGSTCVLGFDVSIASTPVPEIYVSIDGQAAQQFNVASSITVTMPTNTTSWPHHLLEIRVKSTSNFLNIAGSAGGSRWSPQNTAIILTQIALAAGGAVSTPTVPGRSILILGDSITEGYKTLLNNGTGTNDCDGSDAIVGWAYEMRRLLGAEVGVVGYGGTSVGGGGTLGVPGLLTNYNLLWSGQSRSFTPAPDLIVIAYGENDGTSTGDATFIANYKTVVNALLAATPSTTKIACMIPFSQKKVVDLTAAISQVGSPRVIQIDTTGMFNTGDSYDGQHPLGIANLGAIAPQVANKLRPILEGLKNRWIKT